MGNGDFNWIANFIWGVADDVLRDLRARASPLRRNQVFVLDIAPWRLCTRCAVELMSRIKT